jgi:hypothetical protein
MERTSSTLSDEPGSGNLAPLKTKTRSSGVTVIIYSSPSWFVSFCALDAASPWETAVGVALMLGGTHQASGRSIGLSLSEGDFASFED